MSLRDELLKVGLINKKQADDAERKQQQQERHAARPAGKHGGRHDNRSGGKHPRRDAPDVQRPKQPAATPPAVAAHRHAGVAAVNPAAAAPLPRVDPSHGAAAAKLARDMEQNRKSQEKAGKKARSAQLAQLIKQHRLAPSATVESYNFVDGGKIRQISVDALLRASLLTGEISIVRHEEHYDLIPTPIVAQLRERDPQIFVASGKSDAPAPEDASYAEFPVPDDLVW